MTSAIVGVMGGTQGVRAIRGREGTAGHWLELALICESGGPWKAMKARIERLCEPYRPEEGPKMRIGKRHTRVAYCIMQSVPGGDVGLLADAPAAVLEVRLKVRIGDQDISLSASVQSEKRVGW